MDHSTLILHPSLALKSPTAPSPEKTIVFDASLINNHADNLPSHFLWPHEDLAIYGAQDELQDPPVDLKGFLKGDRGATDHATAQIRAACLNHGFFQVINHDVDPTVIQSVYKHMDHIFNLPISSKKAIKGKLGRLSGYSGAHSDRFSSKLPWKETFSLTYNHADDSHEVVDYVIKSSLGQDFEEAGCVFQKYCEAMKKLSLAVFELLGMSLGVDRLHYRKFFEDGCSILRGNNYPPCRDAGLTFGTGPHCDPSSLTILHQDQVGGLQIFLDNKWQAIRPRPDAFVVNIGDTFMALCNGRYRSCVHRAVVNKERARRSVVFFVNPREDKVVRPPDADDDDDDDAHRRRYPDFTWSAFRDFTQNHYRADTDTFPNFVRWLNQQNL